MDATDSQYKAHVFVCTNQKKNGDCCAPHGAEEIRRELKEWTKHHPEWKGRIRVNASGCLDRCEHGVAVAIYPQNIWFENVRASDIEPLKAKITRLMESSSPNG